MDDTPWIVLDRVIRDGWVRIKYSDSRGDEVELPVRRSDLSFPAVDDPKIALQRHAALQAIGRKAAALVPWRHELRLAVFIDPAAASGVAGQSRDRAPTAAEDFIDLIKSLDLSQRIQIVQLAKGRWRRRSPFQLPLDVLTVGAAARAFDQALGSRGWLREISGAGLTATNKWVRELFRRVTNGRETDMLICEHETLNSAIAALRLTRHRPRLVVSLIKLKSADAPMSFPRARPPDGTSLLLLPFGAELGSEREALVELLHDFSHDLPLHELGRRIGTDDRLRRRPSYLVSYRRRSTRCGCRMHCPASTRKSSNCRRPRRLQRSTGCDAT